VITVRDGECRDATLAAVRRLQESGMGVDTLRVAHLLGISRRAAWDRLKALRRAGLLEGVPIEPAPRSGGMGPGIRDAELAARIGAVREAARRAGRPLMGDELEAILS
jgi:DNA-binding Lrp family transcriptional regulator